MKIEVHSLLHNEADILPYFMRHYSQFADVIFYESDSTDGSAELARKLGAKVVPLKTDNELNEIIFLQMKNNCWKNSKADWVIIVDTDEFVYSPDLVRILENTPCTIMYPKEWRMYSFEFPTTEGQIYEQVMYGIPGVQYMNKMNVFRPSEIKEMNYTAGCHQAQPEGNVKICLDTTIKTLHFHDIGLEYRLKRNAYFASRLSEINKKNAWGYHVLLSDEKIIAEFEKAFSDCIKVL